VANKSTYKAYVQNDSGAGEFAGSSNNLTQLKAEVRAKYGAGWNVTIEKIEHDGNDGQFAPVEVARFTLRK
jgi:hypothetical protein